MRTTSLALAFVLAAAALPALGQPDPAQPAPAQGDAAAGEAAFNTQCRGCHSGMIGPVLTGVAERNIATVDGYAYSAALAAKKSDKWTDANLDAFLTAPGIFAPGTKMGMSVTDAAARANVIAYLKTLK